MWIHGLNSFPLAEVQAAVDALILNPPEGWSGMPKLPDVIRQIHANREYRAEQARLKQGEEVLKEMRELEKRRDAGEKFYGLSDLAKELPSLGQVKAMPEPKTKECPDLDLDKNAEKLQRQKEQLLNGVTSREL